MCEHRGTVPVHRPGELRRPGESTPTQQLGFSSGIFRSVSRNSRPSPRFSTHIVRCLRTVVTEKKNVTTAYSLHNLLPSECRFRCATSEAQSKRSFPSHRGGARSPPRADRKRIHAAAPSGTHEGPHPPRLVSRPLLPPTVTSSTTQSVLLSKSSYATLTRHSSLTPRRPAVRPSFRPVGCTGGSSRPSTDARVRDWFSHGIQTHQNEGTSGGCASFT